jgi:RNA polymerase sigma factor (sigma-70 family)
MEKVLRGIEVEQLLAGLTAEDREIINLYYWHGMKMGEIGEEIGKRFRGGKPLSAGTVSKYRNRILTSLQEQAGV